VLPVSHTGRWLESFAVVEQLGPKVIVPGHGPVTTLATARADTQAYLQALREHMKKAVAEMADSSVAVKSFGAAPFMRLLNAAELMPGNASRTDLELEREQGMGTGPSRGAPRRRARRGSVNPPASPGSRPWSGCARC
jgi:glyoxylase-like metal-dependent hydrolase (beta-lactamase superfamily II)